MGIHMPVSYGRIVATIRSDIRSGKYPPGSTLPAEPELAQRFGVSRSTVNRALSLLRSEGLVRPQQGRGTVVNPRPVIKRNAAARQRRDMREGSGGRGAFDAELRSLGLEPRSDVQVGRSAVPGTVAPLLGTTADVVFRRREMYADAVPVQLATSYIPADLAEGTPIAQPDTGPGGLYSRLADVGHAPVRFAELVQVRTPDDAEADFLQLDQDQRVYVITRIAYDSDDRPIEVCVHVLPTHQWDLAYEWPAEQPE
jgi:GntR family transcriptional regulator